jgi:hypothetical protein
MTVSRHEERFPAPRLSAGYRINQKTFAGTRGNGRDAPIPDLRGIAIKPPESTLSPLHDRPPRKVGPEEDDMHTFCTYEVAVCPTAILVCKKLYSVTPPDQSQSPTAD